MRILLTGACNFKEEQINRIRALGFTVDFLQNEKDEIDCSVYDGVVCNGLFLHHPIEEFQKLKFIQLTSAGYDRVPMGYCEEHGIEVFNAKGVYSIPMAEWCILQVLNAYKTPTFFENNKKNKAWQKKRDVIELAGKNACIVGFGNIGNEIAKRLKAFDVNVFAVDIAEPEGDLFDEFYEIKDIKNALIKSDIVILTLPLTDKTENIFSGAMFSVMKENSMLINISRGAVVDESALIDYIKRGKFLKVCLDVFETEPLAKTNELWDFENVFISPHNSFVGEGNNDRLFALVNKNIGGIK